jgi:hypothetical protein
MVLHMHGISTLLLVIDQITWKQAPAKGSKNRIILFDFVVLCACLSLGYTRVVQIAEIVPVRPKTPPPPLDDELVDVEVNWTDPVTLFNMYVSLDLLSVLDGQPLGFDRWIGSHICAAATERTPRGSALCSSCN